MLNTERLSYYFYNPGTRWVCSLNAGWYSTYLYSSPIPAPPNAVADIEMSDPGTRWVRAFVNAGYSTYLRVFQPDLCTSKNRCWHRNERSGYQVSLSVRQCWIFYLPPSIPARSLHLQMASLISKWVIWVPGEFQNARILNDCLPLSQPTFATLL